MQFSCILFLEQFVQKVQALFRAGFKNTNKHHFTLEQGDKSLCENS